MLPDQLKGRARHLARKRGISLGQLIRESLEAALKNEGALSSRRDPLFSDAGVYQDEAPSDLSLRHDEYLYGAGTVRGKSQGLSSPPTTGN